MKRKASQHLSKRYAVRRRRKLLSQFHTPLHNLLAPMHLSSFHRGTNVPMLIEFLAFSRIVSVPQCCFPATLHLYCKTEISQWVDRASSEGETSYGKLTLRECKMLVFHTSHSPVVHSPYPFTLFLRGQKDQLHPPPESC